MLTYNPVFLSHGAPSLLTGQSQARTFLEGFADQIGTPSAVIIVSAHWESDVLLVTGSENPETIHDFRGFGDKLARYVWPVSGDPDLASDIVDTLISQGFRAGIDPDRGVDHGVWVPLALIWPDAEIPVVQLSLPARDTETSQLLDIGKALQACRDQETLVIFSGSMTHSLRDALSAPESDLPQSFAEAFAKAARHALATGDQTAIANWTRWPEAARNHPTPEHFHPLIMAAGMGDGTAHQLHESWTHGALAMDVWGWPRKS